MPRVVGALLLGFGSTTTPVVPAPSGASRGAPSLAVKNSFEPMQFCKVPNGDLIGVNGVDQGILWDGMAAAAYNLGIAPPAAAPTVTTTAAAGGATSGSYNFYYRYVDWLGRPSTLSPVTVVQANTNDQFNWTFVWSPEHTRIWGGGTVELWRTVSGGANVIYKVTSISVTTTTTFTDQLSDATLQQAALQDTTTTLQVYNDDGSPDAVRFIAPPTNKKSVVWYLGRGFYGGDVQYTAGTADVTNNSTTVVGHLSNWTPQMLGRYFYGAGAGAPRGYLIDGVTPAAPAVSVVTAGSAPANEVQTITLPAATGGTFTVTLDAATTGNNAYNITAANLQTNLQALSTIGAGNCAVTLASLVYTVTFQAAMGNKAVDLMSANGNGLTGIPAKVTELVKGGTTGGQGGGVGQEQAIGFTTSATQAGLAAGYLTIQVTGGQFTLTFNGHTTPPISIGAAPGPTAAAIQAQLQALPSIGTGNCTVTGPIGTDGSSACANPYNCGNNGNSYFRYNVIFSGALQGIALPLITTNVAPQPPSSGVQYYLQGTPYAQINVLDQIMVAGGSGGGSGAGVNELQEIKLPAGTSGGTFTITQGANTTAAIAWNATAAVVQAALVAASGAGTFTVTSPGGLTYDCTFTGTLGSAAQPLLTVNTASLSGGTITTAITVQGTPGASGVQSLILGGATGGTFTLSYAGQTTGNINWNDTAATIQTALQGLSTIGAGNILVTGNVGGPFTMTFAGTLANQTVSTITANTTGLLGFIAPSQLTLHTAYLGTTQAGASYMIRPIPDERNQLFFSEQFEPESVPVTNTIKVQSFTTRDDEVVGLAVYAGYMYILMSMHVLRFEYQSDPQFDGEASLIAERGAFNKFCFDVSDDIAFLMDQEGAYVLMPYRSFGMQLSQLQPISDNIQDYWRDGKIDMTKSNRFWVKCDPVAKLAYFGVSLVGDTSIYPSWALTFSYQTGAWWLTKFHEPMAAATVYPIAARRRLLFGGGSGLVHLSGQGNADGIDSTTETGTITGTVTSATSSSITDTSASFSANTVGAPVAIIAGTGKGQTAVVSSRTSTALQITGTWTTVPDTTSVYLVGAIPWTVQTGSLEYLTTLPAGEVPPMKDFARAVRLAWLPTVNSAKFDIRKFENNASVADTLYGLYDQGDGLTVSDGDVSAVQQMKSNMETVEGSAALAIGYTRYQFDSSGEDKSQINRWLSVMLTGFQGLDRIVFYEFEVDGCKAGGQRR